MYIPPKFLLTDKDEIVAFMQKYSFATIVSTLESKPSATHLPIITTLVDDKIVLKAHFAKANEQWKEIANNDNILVIFNEPHAYISPSHYEKELNVPTWNYFSVHAYGKGKIIFDHEETIKILEQTIDAYEPSYKLQWDGLPEDYKQKMVSGIVAFEVEIFDLQAKKKLSQNRTPLEQKNIANALSKSEHSVERDLATFMKKEL